MKKINFKSTIAMVFGAIMSLAFVVQAHAMTPSVSIVNNGNNYIQVNVYGDGNSSVILDYYMNGQIMGAGVIGYTNYAGSFSGQLNPGNYNIPNGSEVVVVVNGQQSSPITWSGSSYNNGGGYNTGSLSLSQTNLTLTAGQSQTITSYNTSGSLYVSSNSNSSVATATVYSNQLTIVGENSGSTTLNVCSTYNGCASVYVTVNGSYYNNQTVTLSQSSVSLTAGQSQTVYINNSYNNNYYNTSNQYYISNSSNGIVIATVSGSTITLYGQSQGTATLNVCSNSNGSYSYNNGSCATLYVTVSGGYYTNPTYPVYPTYPTYPTYPVYNTPLSVSNNNVQVTVGNTGVVSLYGGTNTVSYPYTNTNYYGSGTYYVNNNYSSVATATVNGSTLTIYGTNPGSTTLSVCSSNGSSQCATIYVTVIAPVYTYNPYGIYNSGYQNNPSYYYSNSLHCWMHY